MIRWRKVIIIFLIAAILTNVCYIRPVCFKSLFDNVFNKTVTAYLNYRTRSFEKLAGERIILKYSSGDRDIAPFMLTLAEDYYQQVKNRLGSEACGDKVLVIVYPDMTSLNNSVGLTGDRSAIGVYWAGNIGVLSPSAMPEQILTQKNAEEVFVEKGPLVHELTHYLVDKGTAGNYTRWLAEGLAQYLEREITGFTLPPPDSESRRRLYSLSCLDKDFDKQPDERLAYWQSLMTVEYLISEYGIGDMQRLLTILGRGAVAEQAIWQVYRLSIDTLEERTELYMESVPKFRNYQIAGGPSESENTYDKK